MKKLIFAGTVALLLLGLGLVVWPHYQNYRTAGTVRQARAFAAAGDFANASLSARQVLRRDPRNLEATRVMADLAELSRSPAALDWRQRLVELDPSVANRMKLASVALKLERPPFPLAARVLCELEPAGRELPAFHVLCAEHALKINQITLASTHFQEAARLDPANELHRFNLAVLNLQSLDPVLAANARSTLERLSTNRDLTVLALRCRIVESLRQKNLPEAARLSGQLVADSRAGLSDRLQHLTILQLSCSPSFDQGLRAVQAEAATNTVAAYTLCEWMGAHGLAPEALDWFMQFDAKTRQRQPMPLALANLYLARQDWEGMEHFLNGQTWEDLEFLRLAFLARAAGGLQQTALAQARWRMAVEAAVGRPAPLSLLLGLSADWGLNSEELLWEIGRRFPHERWALLELEKRYLASRDTRGLHRVYEALLSSDPDASDLTNRNNFATSSLLLKLNLAQAHETARSLYRQLPDDPVIGSTYAYSLHLQGRTGEGLAVFGKFKPEALRTPSIALYYGVLLASTVQSDQAGRFLALVDPATLSPEEKQLLEEAKARLRQECARKKP